MNRLTGRTVLVTGAGRGIGRAIADHVVAEGGRVAVTDVDGDAAAATAAALGDAALGLVADVTDRASVGAAVEAAVERFGRLDVLVNNAGWDIAGPFVESDPAVWDRIVGINLFGVLNTTRAVLPLLVAQRSGSVVNLASDAGRVGSAGEAVYSAAKGGVIAFTKAVAREVARHGVNVNCVCPGPTDTALFASMGGDDPKLRESLVRAIPFRRLAEPADLAHAVVFLASGESSYITGQTVSVSGGLTMS